MVNIHVTVDESLRGAHTWLEACPHPEEKGFLSVIIGRNSFMFASHGGEAEEYRPHTFWRVPINSVDEFPGGDAKSRLVQYLPECATSLFYSDPAMEDISVEKVVDHMVTLKRIPAVSIYVISKSEKGLHRLARLFSHYPVRLVLLGIQKPSHDWIYAEHWVALQAIRRPPALVINAGEILTATVVDNDGNIVGGGVSPGIMAQVASLQKGRRETGFGSSQEIVNNLKSRSEPLTNASTSREDELLDGIVRPVVVSMASMVYDFTKKYGVKEGAERDHVFVTGDDVQLIKEILGSSNEHFIMEPCQPNKVSATWGTQLMHRGIATLLLRDTPAANAEYRNLCLQVRGNRVAKDFGELHEDSNGDSIYLGVVVHVDPPATFSKYPWDDTSFHIKYDDGDIEEMSVDDLIVALREYVSHGEKRGNLLSKEAKAAKVQGASSMASTLEGVRSPTPDMHEQGGDSWKSVKANELGNAKRDEPPSQTPERTSRKRGRNGKRQIPKDQQPEDLVGRRIAKYFGTTLFFGSVRDFSGTGELLLWRIVYDDDDMEELNYDELRTQLDLYDSHHGQDAGDIQDQLNCVSDGEAGGARGSQAVGEKKDVPVEVSDHEENPGIDP